MKEQQMNSSILTPKALGSLIIPEITANTACSKELIQCSWFSSFQKKKKIPKPTNLGLLRWIFSAGYLQAQRGKNIPSFLWDHTSKEKLWEGIWHSQVSILINSLGKKNKKTRLKGAFKTRKFNTAKLQEDWGAKRAVGLFLRNPCCQGIWGISNFNSSKFQPSPERFQHETFQGISGFMRTLSTLYTDKNQGKTNSSRSSKALLDLITC